MGILGWLSWKMQQSAASYLQSSIRIMEGAGQFGAKPRPFSYEAAVREFRSWVYAAVNLNAYGVASVPMRLYIRKPGMAQKSLWRTREPGYARKRYLLDTPGVGQKLAELGDDWQEVIEDHPILKLLRRPNSFMSGFEATAYRVMHLELTGNSYMHPVCNAYKLPDELWPMPSQWVTIIPSLDDFIDGYAYGQTGQTKQRFEVDEVIHSKYPNPDNLFYGRGKIEAGWGCVSVNGSIHTYDLATYDNHARPDYAVIVKSGSSPDAIDRYAQKLYTELRGNKNAGKFITITGDVEMKPLNFPPKDLAGREQAVEEIAAVFGVPVTMLKANDPNLASATVGKENWERHTLSPICHLDEDVLNARLLPIFGLEGDAVLAYDSPSERDDEIAEKRLVSFVRAGIITRNEARAEEGYAASVSPGADELMLAPPGVNARGEEQVGGTGGAVAQPGAAEVPAPQATAPAKAHKREHEHEHEHKAKPSLRPQLVAHAAAMATAIEPVLQQQASAVNRWVRRYGKARRKSQADLDSLAAELRSFDPMLADSATASIQRSIIDGGAEGLDAISLPNDTWGITNPAVAESAKNAALKLTGRVQESTIDAIKKTLGDGLDAGESTAQLTQRIEDAGTFSRARAEMIGRTESARAFSEGTAKAWKASGAVKGMKWLASDGCCEFCQAMADKAEEVGLDDSFYDKGDSIDVDGKTLTFSYSDVNGPPLHPNCSCALEPVMTDEE